jgi:L-lactate dehydrogenase (cytochrome)
MHHTHTYFCTPSCHWPYFTDINIQGKDATEEFDPIHPRDTLDKYLDKSLHLGPVDMSTVAQEAKREDPEEVERQKRIAEMPLLSECFNLHDFEAIARRTMKKGAWGYYSSAADDEIVRSSSSSRSHL